MVLIGVVLLVQYTRRSTYWVAALVGNWATRFYKYIRQDVEAKQVEVETAIAAQAVS
jgi:dipeptidase